MSHDRGCYICHEDHPRHAAKTCMLSRCPYKEKPMTKEPEPQRNSMSHEQLDAYSKMVVNTINSFAHECNANSRAHGFYDEPANLGEKIALMHSELSEALEYARKDINAKSEKIPEFTGIEEEFADAVIRILDTAAEMKLNLGGAIIAKHAYNKSRPYKHGKQF